MSRIGRMPIAIPAGVTVDIAENNQVTVKGPKGTLETVLVTVLLSGVKNLHFLLDTLIRLRWKIRKELK